MCLYMDGWSNRATRFEAWATHKACPSARCLFMPNHANISRHNATTGTNGEWAWSPGHNNCSPVWWSARD